MTTPEGQHPERKPTVKIPGAYEDFEGKREHLETVTRGRLPQVGDRLPETIIPTAGVRVLNIVNALSTPACDTYTRNAERIFNPYQEEIGLFHVSKQAPDEMRLEDEQEGEITSPRVSISQEQAIELGVELEPGEGADPEFWPTAARRTVIVAKDGQIVYVEQPENQDQEPNYQAALEAAKQALQK